MLIDGEKWACEACVRGHRVSTCKHHDRPLIRINRKGRPFSTCSICNCTPCNLPDEHNKLKREAELRAQAQNRASGRHARSNPPALLPLAPRPASSSPPSETQSSSRSGYGNSRGSQPPESTASTPRSRAAVATGGRGAPQGAPHHRTNSHSHSHCHSQNPSSPRSGSVSMRYLQHQQYSPQHQAAPVHYGGLSPLSMPLGSFPPSLCSISDIPASMSMVSPFDHPYGDPSLLDGSGGAAVFPSLEDFDLGGLPDELMQEDWRWFADDNELR